MRGFPAVAVPLLAAVVALIVTTAYATVYGLTEWGSIGQVGLFLSDAAPTVFGSPFIGHSSLREWLTFAPFGGGWVIAIPLVALLLTTALLGSRTRTGIGGRLAIGGTAFLPMAIFTCLLTLLNYALIQADYGYYYDGLGEVLARNTVGATIVGLLGGLPGALLSIALRPPTRSTDWR